LDKSQKSDYQNEVTVIRQLPDDGHFFFENRKKNYHNINFFLDILIKILYYLLYNFKKYYYNAINFYYF